MSKVHTIEGCIGFTRGGATTFSGIGSIISGEARLLGIRPGIGFGKLVAICKVVSAAPGAVAGTLSVEQSADGVNWDYAQTFSMGAGSATRAISIEVVTRYIRAWFTVPSGEVYNIRFGGFLNPIGGGGGSGSSGGGGEPGTTITSPADVSVNAAATEPLPVAPADTRRMRVQVTGGDDTTRIRVRELGGTAGTGILLTLLGSTLYGGADGAIADLEVENVAGPTASVAVQFEGD